MISNMLDYMLDFYNMTNSCNADVIYKGALWHENIEEIGTVIRRKMDSDNLSSRDCRAYFSIFVEMMSNMLKYSADKTDGGVTKGAFFSVYENGAYYALCGNLMKIEHKELIKSRIDNLNSMDKMSLRRLYINELKTTNINPENEGAGLGLIEIAKCASTPIEYEFFPHDEQLTFFTMRASVSLMEAN
ncbi:MAG: SiaB family protein kinase [Oscillospiraceae bacterium]|nr:SiaB family protein kinase [Oscillospiraceae bacterium]